LLAGMRLDARTSVRYSPFPPFRRVSLAALDHLVWLPVVAIAVGIALRVWVLASPLGSLDADEAVRGLMARHVLEGEFSVFFWLQAYAGSQDALITAVLFALLGSTTLVLKLEPLLLYALAAILVWRIGRRALDERAARLAAAVFWVWPPFLVWFSTKALYGFGLVCSLVVVLLVLRLAERPTRVDAGALGLALGLGWWAVAQMLLLLVLPFLAWLAVRRPAVLRLAWIAGLGFFVGAAPWLAWNATNDWLSLRVRPDAGVESGYLERLIDTVTVVLPTWLGLRVPYSLDWLVGEGLGAAVFILAVLGFAYALVRWPPRLRVLLATVALFPFAVALSPFAYYVDTPRYVVAIAPAIALLLGALLARHRTLAVAGITIAVALSVAGLVRLERDGLHVIGHDRGGIPKDITPLIALLERERVDRVLADYWIAYRITFESDERVIATSTGFVRYAPHDRLVRAAKFPAHVYLPRDPREAAQRAELEARGYRRVESGRFVVYLPPRPA
jgi:4-amino-4-deoxy-L-arabinose transferase-like glycosyltransferase